MRRLFRREGPPAGRVDLREPAAHELARKLERLTATSDTRLARTYASAPEIWLTEVGHLAGQASSPPFMSYLLGEAERLADALDEMVEGEATPDWSAANPDVVRAIAFGVAWEVSVPVSASMTYQWGLYLTLITQHGLKTKGGFY
ncbi:MAG: hypothetical protein M3R02_10475 [Chloroflexota bacterium]|nr:hypothetical protein [Chloroflexota bacterium]